jgi:hypothetical protein
VVWEDGCAKLASINVGDFEPLRLGDIAAKRAQASGPIVAAASVNPTAWAPGFTTQLWDVEVDALSGALHRQSSTVYSCRSPSKHHAETGITSLILGLSAN